MNDVSAINRFVLYSSIGVGAVVSIALSVFLLVQSEKSKKMHVERSYGHGGVELYQKPLIESSHFE